MRIRADSTEILRWLINIMEIPENILQMEDISEISDILRDYGISANEEVLTNFVDEEL